jgi:hypothetical protein
MEDFLNCVAKAFVLTGYFFCKLDERRRQPPRLKMEIMANMFMFFLALTAFSDFLLPGAKAQSVEENNTTYQRTVFSFDALSFWGFLFVEIVNLATSVFLLLVFSCMIFVLYRFIKKGAICAGLYDNALGWHKSSTRGFAMAGHVWPTMVARRDTSEETFDDFRKRLDSIERYVTYIQTTTSNIELRLKIQTCQYEDLKLMIQHLPPVMGGEYIKAYEQTMNLRRDIAIQKNALEEDIRDNELSLFKEKYHERTEEEEEDEKSPFIYESEGSVGYVE